jgi:hypothetical protein
MGVARVERFWSQFLGVSQEALRTPGVTVVQHKDLGSYPGAWFFVRGTSGIVSAPETWVPRLRISLSGASATTLHDMSVLRRLLNTGTEGMIGPSYQGYVELEEFHADRRHPVRSLRPSERPMLEAFLATCPADEKTDSGIDPSRLPSVGSFADGTLVAVAQYRERSSFVGDPCVLTRPTHRRARHGASVVSAVVEQALARGALVLYQTLLSNTSAVQLARRLGFQQFASLVAVKRLG